MESQVRLSSGRITIPKHIRDELGLTGGMKLEWHRVDGHIEAKVVKPDAGRIS